MDYLFSHGWSGKRKQPLVTEAVSFQIARDPNRDLRQKRTCTRLTAIHNVSKQIAQAGGMSRFDHTPSSGVVNIHYPGS
jgi:hypothetical protein